MAIQPFYGPSALQMVVLYDKGFSSLFVPQMRYLLAPKTHWLEVLNTKFLKLVVETRNLALKSRYLNLLPKDIEPQYRLG